MNVRFYLSYGIKITLKSHFCRKKRYTLSLCTQRCYECRNVCRKSISTSGLSILLHGVISLSDATSYDTIKYHTQDINEKLTNSQLDITNESQEVSPFLAGGPQGINKQTRIKVPNVKLTCDLLPKATNLDCHIPISPGRVAQSVTCLATDACLTADPGVASSIPARYHTFVEIDHEIISTVILLPSADLFKKGCCQLQAKVCAQITG